MTSTTILRSSIKDRDSSKLHGYSETQWRHWKFAIRDARPQETYTLVPNRCISTKTDIKSHKLEQLLRAVPCSFAITVGIPFGFLSPAY